jgi:hypothetical protein
MCGWYSAYHHIVAQIRRHRAALHEPKNNVCWHLSLHITIRSGRDVTGGAPNQKLSDFEVQGRKNIIAIISRTESDKVLYLNGYQSCTVHGLQQEYILATLGRAGKGFLWRLSMVIIHQDEQRH